MNEYTLTLTAQETQAVVSLIAKLSIEQGLDLFNKVKNQIQEQEDKNGGE